MSPVGRRSTIFLLALVLIGMITFAGQMVWSWLDPFNDEAFNSPKWLAGDADVRAGMARNLVDHYLPERMSTEQVVSLLGPPLEKLTGADSGGNTLLGSQTFVYAVGWSNLHGFDDAFVYVHLNSDGRVVGSEINGY